MTINPWDETDVTDYAERFALVQAGVTPEGVAAYEEAGVLNRGDMVKLSRNGISPKSAESYISHRFTVDQAILLIKKKVTADTLVELRDRFPQASFDDLVEMRKVGMSKSFLAQMKKLGVTDISTLKVLAHVPATEFADAIKAGASLDDIWDGVRYIRVRPLSILLRKKNATHLESYFSWSDKMVDDDKIAEVTRFYEAGMGPDWYRFASNSREFLGRLDGATFEEAKEFFDLGVTPSIASKARSALSQRYVSVEFDAVEFVRRLISILGRPDHVEDFLSKVGSINSIGNGLTGLSEAFSERLELFAPAVVLVPSIRYSSSAHLIYPKDATDAFVAMKADIVRSGGDANLWLRWVEQFTKGLRHPTKDDRIDMRKKVIKYASYGVTPDEYKALDAVGTPPELMRDTLARAKEIQYGETVNAAIDEATEDAAPTPALTDEEWENG